MFSWLFAPIPPVKDWWLSGIIVDESGYPSAKRTIGIVTGLALVFALIWNVLRPETVISPNLVEALTWICIGCLGLSTADKFSASAKVLAEGDVAEAEAIRSDDRADRAKKGSK